MKITKITDIGTIWQASFDDEIGAIRIIPVQASLAPLGSVASAVRVGREASVTFFQSSGSTMFVKFGAAGVVAPTTAADGLPVPSGVMVTYYSGSNTYVIGSGAVYAYSIPVS
jgi:hypothetical protein